MILYSNTPCYKITFHDSKKSYILTEDKIEILKIMTIGLEDRLTIEALK